MHLDATIRRSAKKATHPMQTLAHSAYLDSTFDAACELPHVGSALENPFVYDASARELKQLSERGLIEILAEHKVLVDDQELIAHVSFRRVR
jgi:hypothetical protein